MHIDKCVITMILIASLLIPTSSFNYNLDQIASQSIDDNSPIQIEFIANKGVIITEKEEFINRYSEIYSIESTTSEIKLPYAQRTGCDFKGWILITGDDEMLFCTTTLDLNTIHNSARAYAYWVQENGIDLIPISNENGSFKNYLPISLCIIVIFLLALLVIYLLRKIDKRY